MRIQWVNPLKQAERTFDSLEVGDTFQVKFLVAGALPEHLLFKCLRGVTNLSNASYMDHLAPDTLVKVVPSMLVCEKR